MSEIWTVRKLIAWTVPWFARNGLNSGRLDVELLLSHAIGCERLDLYLNPDAPVTEEERSVFKSYIKRRAAREPVAYIIGYREFWKRRFRVDTRVLIPRPETECLIEFALSKLNKTPHSTIADLGTGSGCIAISLAAECPFSTVYATDLSTDALEIARINAQAAGVADRILLRSGRWFEALGNDEIQGNLDMIVSNPPYIPTGDIGHLQPEIALFEPKMALDGGEKGMDPYKILAAGASGVLKPDGWLIVEIGFNQADDVIHCFSNAGFQSINVITDLAGHDRIAAAKKTTVDNTADAS